MVRKFAAKRRAEFGIRLSERQRRIYEFLRANPVGVLSTVTPDNNPHGAAIYFSIDKHFSIFFITKSHTRKSDNLRHNSHVMLTVFEPNSQTTTQIIGTATELTDTTAVNGVAGAVLSACMKTSNAGLPPISKLQAGTYVAYQIKPAQIRLAVYSKSLPANADYTDLFESIESFELELA